MRALVTGANGFVGVALSKRLAVPGNVVRALVREGSDASGLKGLSLELFRGDVTEPRSLTAAVEGVDVVFHLAGIRRCPTREPFFAVNAQGTRNLCEAMVAAPGRPRLVFCGSLAASGPSTADRPREEADPLTPTEWYGESKAEAERIAFGYSDRMEVTAIRPARILGPGDLENLAFFKMVKRGVRLKLSGAPRPLSMVDVDDVVELLLLLAEKKEAVGEAFFCAAPGPLTLLELEDRVAVALKVEPRTVPVPPGVLQLVAAGADLFSTVSGKHLALNRKLARQLLAPAWTCSTAKAERLLGFRARVRLEESVERSADSYVRRGWL